MSAPWFAPPSLPIDELAAIAHEHFGVDGHMSPLRGERDQNTLIVSADGSYVLKIAGVNERPEAIDFQCRALEHVADTDPELPVPRVVRSTDDAVTVRYEIGGGVAVVRMLTYLDGDTFDDDVTLSSRALIELGSLQGRLARALASFDHPGAGSFMPWALDSGTLGNDDLWSGLADDSNALAGPVRERVTCAIAAIAGLPRQVIHNDAHCGNLLRDASTDPERIVGVIDFGDLVGSARVADLAVSGASFAAGRSDPIDCLVHIAAGYHAVHPLTKIELHWLSDLVLCRIVLSTLMTDFQMNHSPHIAAAVTAERSGHHDSLRSWTALDRDEVAAQLDDTLHPER